MTRKQVLVVVGMIGAIVVCAGTAWLSLGRAPAAELASADRLALAAQWMLVPGLCLLVGVGVTANRRFLSGQAIDGGPPTPGSAFDINLRYNLNTLEQAVLAAVAWSGLALTLRPENLSLIPALAGLFAVGRIAFWIGYLFAPWARAFGLGLTFYPTAAALVWLAVRTVA